MAAQPSGDDGVVVVVGLEGVLGEVPLPGLRVRVSARVVEAAAGQRGQVRGVEAEAAVVLVAERREHLGPHHRHALGLARHPGRGTEVRDRVPGRHVAHHLDADDARNVVPVRLEVGHRREHRHAPRRARGLVARGRQAHEGRVGFDQQAAEVGLAAEDLGAEVGHVPDLDVRRVDAGIVECVLHGLGEHRREVRTLPAPGPGEVRLRAAEDEDRCPRRHGTSRWVASSSAPTHHVW